jgi:hypothetical protein
MNIAPTAAPFGPQLSAKANISWDPDYAWEARHYFTAALDDFTMASKALTAGSEAPSWVGTRLLDAGNNLMEALPAFREVAPTSTDLAHGVGVARDGARALGRPLCTTNTLPQNTTPEQLAAQLQTWSTAVSQAMGAVR